MKGFKWVFVLRKTNKSRNRSALFNTFDQPSKLKEIQASTVLKNHFILKEDFNKISQENRTVGLKRN